MNKPTLITKEELHSIAFGEQDVLRTEEERSDRRWQLNRAVILGNLYRNKVKLTFKNSAGYTQEVETTLWSVTEEYVVLKGGRYIPIKAIEAIF
jgi:hypothetical protein